MNIYQMGTSLTNFKGRPLGPGSNDNEPPGGATPLSLRMPHGPLFTPAQGAVDSDPDPDAVPGM